MIIEQCTRPMALHANICAQKNNKNIYWLKNRKEKLQNEINKY